MSVDMSLPNFVIFLLNQFSQFTFSIALRGSHLIVAIYQITFQFKLLFGYSVWQKLEEENADFFRAYYIRLKLKKQIILFNNLLEHQYHLMKYPVPPKVPLAPIQNGIHPMQGKLCFTFLLTKKSKIMLLL